jgi:hypothetical protein
MPNQKIGEWWIGRRSFGYGFISITSSALPSRFIGRPAHVPAAGRELRVPRLRPATPG